MSTNSVVLPVRQPFRVGSLAVVAAIKALYAVLLAPEYIFLAALTAMLFRPPDLQVLPIDRIGFVTLIAAGSLISIALNASDHPDPRHSHDSAMLGTAVF